MNVRSTLLAIFYIVMALPLNDLKPNAFLILFNVLIELFILLVFYVAFYRDSDSFFLDRLLTFVGGVLILVVLYVFVDVVGGMAEDLESKVPINPREWNPFVIMKNAIIVNAAYLIIVYSIDMYYLRKKDKQAQAIQPHIFYQTTLLALLAIGGLPLFLIFGFFGKDVFIIALIACRLLFEYFFYKKMTAPTKENTEV